MCIYSNDPEVARRQIERRKKSIDQLVRKAMKISKERDVSLTKAMYIVFDEDLQSAT